MTGKKVVWIKNCYERPHTHFRDETSVYCEMLKSDVVINDDLIIPEICPLEDWNGDTK